MHHNRRAPIPTSQIDPHRVSLRRGERYQVACPWCDRWRFLLRGMLEPHRRGDGTARCPGSGQRIILDETEAQWRDRQHQKAQELTACRAVVAAVRAAVAPRRPRPHVFG